MMLLPDGQAGEACEFTNKQQQQIGENSIEK